MQPDTFVSAESYLDLDATSDTKYEYWSGRVVAMAGAEPEHNKITANLTFELMGGLRDRDCSVVASDQRVQVGDRYVYPDVVVTCGVEKYADTRPRTLLNPSVLIEVLSATTLEADLEQKLLAYIRLDSVQEYWIVSVGRPLIMQYVRRAEEWVLHAIVGLSSTVKSEHLGIGIGMQDVYRRVLDEDVEGS